MILSSCQVSRQTDPSFELPSGERWQAYTSDGAEAYQESKFGEAKEKFAKAVELARQFGPDDKRLISSLIDLANCYSSEGQYQLSIPLYAEASKIAEKLNLKDSEQLVYECLLGEGKAYVEQRKYELARPVFTRLFNVAMAMPAKNLDFQKLTFSIVEFYISQGTSQDGQSALSLLKRLEAIEKQQWGKDSPRVGAVFWRQARVLLGLKSYGESMQKFKEFLDIDVKQEHRAQTYMMMNNYIAHLARDDRTAEIEDLRKYFGKLVADPVEPSRPSEQTSLKQTHPGDRKSLASLYEAAKNAYSDRQFDRCEPLFEELVSLAEQQHLPPDNPLYYAILLSQGSTYSELGKFDEADAVYDRLSAITEKMPSRRPDLQTRYFLLTDYYLSRHTAQSSNRALKLLKRLEDIEKKATHKNDKLLAQVCFRQARALVELDRYAESMAKFRQFVQLDKDSLDDLQTRMKVYSYTGRLEKKNRKKEVEEIKSQYGRLLRF